MIAARQTRGQLDMQLPGLNIYTEQSCTENARICRVSCARSGKMWSSLRPGAGSTSNSRVVPGGGINRASRIEPSGGSLKRQADPYLTLSELKSGDNPHGAADRCTLRTPIVPNAVGRTSWRMNLRRIQLISWLGSQVVSPLARGWRDTVWKSSSARAAWLWFTWRVMSGLTGSWR